MTSVIGIEVMTLSSMRYLSQQVYLIIYTLIEIVSLDVVLCVLLQVL